MARKTVTEVINGRKKMADKKEADKLWCELVAVEASQPPAGAGLSEKQAFLQSKGREVQRLKAAYEKAVGRNIDPNNAAGNAQAAESQLLRRTDNPEDRHTTNDDLSKLPKWYREGDLGRRE